MPLHSSVKSIRTTRLLLLLPAGAGMALALAGDLTLYAILPAYAVGMGISLASIGLLLSANRLVRFISNPLVGLLANRFSRKGMIAGGFALGMISTLLYLPQNQWLILLGRLVWGISWSIMYIGTYCMILDVTDGGDRGWGTGMLQTFYFIGIAFTPVFGSLISSWLGFSGGLLACALLQGLGLAVALVFQKETYLPDRAALAPISPGERLRAARARLGSFSWGWLRSQREFILTNYLYMTTLFVGDGITMSTITLYLQQRYGDSYSLNQFVMPITAVGGSLIALRAIISGGVGPLTGRWSDRSVSRWTAAAWGAVVTIAGCGLLAIDGGMSAILLGVCLAAFGSGMLLAVLPAIVSDIHRQQSSFAMGLLSTSGDLGSAIAPLAGYAMLKILSLSTLYLVSAGLLMIGVIACLLAARKRS